MNNIALDNPLTSGPVTLYWEGAANQSEGPTVDIDTPGDGTSTAVLTNPKGATLSYIVVNGNLLWSNQSKRTETAKIMKLIAESNTPTKE